MNQTRLGFSLNSFFILDELMNLNDDHEAFDNTKEDDLPEPSLALQHKINLGHLNRLLALDVNKNVSVKAKKYEIMLDLALTIVEIKMAGLKFKFSNVRTSARLRVLSIRKKQ